MGTLTESLPLREAMRMDFRRYHAALMFAESKHRAQVDKAGEPYIWHPMRVGTSLLPDLDAAVLGILHDVIEDTDATLAEAAMFMHLDSEMIQDLGALTRRKDIETYQQYLDRVAKRPRAVRVKIADLWDNLDEARLERARVHQGDEFVTRKKLRYELALSHLGGSKVITFCPPEPKAEKEGGNG